MKFPCTSCGACCRRVGAAVKAGLITREQFPHPVSDEGVCSQLKKDGTCAVYETRPQVCRIPVGEPLSYYAKTAEWCNGWIVEDGLDKKYLVVIESVESETKPAAEILPKEDT